MVMVPLPRRMIPEAASPQVGLCYQTELLQELQGAVDSRDINMGVFSHNLGIDFLGADMVIAILNSVYYHHPLRSQPISLLA